MQRVADVVEGAARDAKIDARTEAASAAVRDRRGRFSRGGAGGDGDRSLWGIGKSLSGRAGDAISGAEQVDPAIAAANEIRGVLSAAKSAVAPIGRLWGAVKPGGKDGDGEQTGWLKRQWKELRDGRKAQAAQNKSMLAVLKDIAAAGGGGGAAAAGGGILPALPGGEAVAGGGVAAALARMAKVGGPALKGLAKRLPVIGALVEAGLGVVEDQRIADDATLSDAERTQKRRENVGGVGGALAGALAGGTAGSLLGPVGTVIGAAAGGFAGSELGSRATGWVSRKYESLRGGAGTVSTGKGDAGGASYGTYQLSSSRGTLQKFLASSPYADQFSGLQPGTPEFDAKWKAVAAADPSFGAAQHDFIERTHYAPQMAKLAGQGIDLSGRGAAVKEAVWSTANQFGPNSGLIGKALAGRDTSSMSDADIVAAIQDYKIANNATLFRSSPAMQAGTLNRAMNEKADLLAIAAPSDAPVTPTLAAAPRIPPEPAPPAIPAMPASDQNAMRRLNSGGGPQPSQPVATPSQELSDRMIAHIVSGGIGAATVVR